MSGSHKADFRREKFLFWRGSGKSIRPFLGAVQHRYDLNNIIFDAKRHNVGRAGDNEFAGTRDPTCATKPRRCGQPLHRSANAQDDPHRRCRVVLSDVVANVLDPSKIPRSIGEAALRHRGVSSL